MFFNLTRGLNFGEYYIELPLNYWTISLLLLIHERSSDSYSKNLFSILDVCVDEIFGKKRLQLTKSRINFDQLKVICGALSKHLFLNHKLNIYSATYQDIINQIENTIQENERISANSREIFDYLILCGILKQKNDHDLYVFRLNGFFEYFLALQMTKDKSFKNQIVENEMLYLAFKNQFEIYCGFERDDIEFLTLVYKRSKDKLQPIFQEYDSDKDKELIKKVNEPEEIEKICRNISVKRALSSQEKAEIEDLTEEIQINAEVHEIVEIDPNEINSELIERHLSILARTFRNLDAINGNKDFIKEVFNFIINGYCDFGFYIIEEFSEITKQEINKDGFIDMEEFPELNLLKFISNFSPVISQSWLFDGLGHYSLERLIKDEIKKLEVNIDQNQYKLFMLYFLLLDIDLSSNREYIAIAMENLKIPLLKYSILLKLNYYLAFKCTNNKQLENELSKYIQKAQLNLDRRSSLGDIHKQIQVKRKMSLIRKDHNK